MTTPGTAIFFDGVTSARQAVAVELGASGLHIGTPLGDPFAEWPYAELAAFSAPEGVLRLNRSGGAILALCDTVVTIPGAAIPGNGAVQSLNVAAAAAVLFYALRSP